MDKPNSLLQILTLVVGGTGYCAGCSGSNNTQVGSVQTGGFAATGGNDSAGGSAVAGGGTGSSASGFPSGWLYTSGNKIYSSNGSGTGTQWMGRGVNVDDIYFCGYNYGLWMTSPEQDMVTLISGLMSNWKPNFIRVSLGMNTFTPGGSWLTNASQFKTPMTTVINAIGGYSNVYALITLRTDTSMNSGLDDATNYPASATDAVYVALVDSFANSNFVMFGIANEPGGNTLSNSAISTMMGHAVSVIRAEEDRLRVPHHIVSVQGNSWTSDISFYSTKPLTYDNVVYEVHGYPPDVASYTYSNIPVILGEYGTLTSSTSASFYSDLESKQISNLAWDFEPYSDCSPDLLGITKSSTNLSPTAWGAIVQKYLIAHAQ
jgi:hypothetical protein